MSTPRGPMEWVVHSFFLNDWNFKMSKEVRCEICYSSLLTYQSGAKAGDIAEEHWTFNGTLICAKCEELIKKRLIEGAFQLCDVPTRKLVFGLTH